MLIGKIVGAMVTKLWGEEGGVSLFCCGVFDILRTFFGPNALVCANIIYMVLVDSCASTLKSPNFLRKFTSKITFFEDLAHVVFNVLIYRYM